MVFKSVRDSLPTACLDLQHGRLLRRAARDPVREPSVPLGAPGGWGLVAWEKTLGDLLSAAGYGCAVYGKWHVGE